MFSCPAGGVVPCGLTTRASRYDEEAVPSEQREDSPSSSLSLLKAVEGQLCCSYFVHIDLSGHSLASILQGDSRTVHTLTQNLIRGCASVNGSLRLVQRCKFEVSSLCKCYWPSSIVPSPLTRFPVWPPLPVSSPCETFNFNFDRQGPRDLDFDQLGPPLKIFPATPISCQ